MTDERKRILTTATLVMVCLSVVVTVAGTTITYRSARAEKQAELRSLALREVKIIEAILGHDSTGHSPADHADPTTIKSCPQCSEKIALVMRMLHESGNVHSGWGEGVEFVLGSRVDDTIRFLLQSQNTDQDDVQRRMEVPWKSTLAEPMRLALSGLSGITEDEDYRGKIVLAAYAPVKLLGWGVVAKIDKDEMSAPFVTAAQNSLLVAVLAIFAGLIVLRTRLNPLIQRSLDNEAKALNAIAELKSQKHALDEHSLVSITDPSGKIIYANDRFCQISRYSRKELIGQDHRIINSGHHPGSFFAELWKTITAGKVWHGQIRNKAKDGYLYWVDSTIVPFKDEAGCITQYVSIRTDISERKRAEAELVESEKRFRSAIADAPIPIMLHAKGGEVISVNKVWTKITGYTPEDIPTLSDWTRLAYGPMQEEAQTRIEKVFEYGTKVDEGEFTITTRHGDTVVWDFCTARVGELTDGRSLVMSAANDVTEYNAATEQLRLAKRVAESSERAKSAFLANMSHEIRTPMTAILGFAENMLDAEQSHVDKLNCVHTIRRNGEYLLVLINDILDLSKIEAGKMTVERMDCQPCHLIAEVTSLMRVRAVSKQLPFNIEYIGAIPDTIFSDATRIRQILINLIGNAIKFTEVGAVRLVTRFVANEEGDQAGKPKEPYLQFDVIDTGRGMTEEQKAKLFQPFTQADSSTSRKFGGTGLGLTISKRFAELLGGDITIAETDVGVGTTFRVTLTTGPVDGTTMLEDPMSSTVVAEVTQATVNAQQLDLKGRHILLAEDGPDNQQLISFILRKAGARVTIAENGEQALGMALASMHRRRQDDPEHPFDIILMDMQMPVMDGYEATSHLRQKGFTGPIIALTAHAMASDRQKCIKAGCDNYATKPIDRNKLISIIHDQLSPSEIPVGV